jgi:hypothetical protein
VAIKSQLAATERMRERSGEALTSNHTFVEFVGRLRARSRTPHAVKRSLWQEYTSAMVRFPPVSTDQAP